MTDTRESTLFFRREFGGFPANRRHSMMKLTDMKAGLEIEGSIGLVASSTSVDDRSSDSERQASLASNDGESAAATNTQSVVPETSGSEKQQAKKPLYPWFRAQPPACRTTHWLRSDCHELYEEFLVSKATRVNERARLLRFGLNQAFGVRKRFPNAQFLEFGVHEGKDIARIGAFLASLDKLATIHGFDSFEGLPEDWKNGQTCSDGSDLHKAGAFDVNGQEPCLSTLRKTLELGNFDCELNNIEFHKGWFKDTMLPFFETHTCPIAFLHADADLYSSTMTFLRVICKKKLLKKGSVILFDEFWNYQGWQEGEYRAWAEIVKEFELKFEYIGYHAPKGQALNTYGFQSVCVMVEKDM